MRIAIGADHAGYRLKELIREHLENTGHDVNDFGAHSLDKKDDYPDFAFPVAKSVSAGGSDIGILVCSTGIGMSITANKVAGIRAALVVTEEFARTARSHNHANIITLPGNGYLDDTQAVKIVDAYLGAEEEEGRHQRRVDKIHANGR